MLILTKVYRSTILYNYYFIQSMLFKNISSTLDLKKMLLRNYKLEYLNFNYCRHRHVDISISTNGPAEYLSRQ